ncbi:Probable serine/threonine-protein kinase fnkA (FNIP repeat-containing protein A) [Durusdinium trenchii]
MPPGQAPDEAEGPREMCLKSADVPLPRSLEILQLNIHRWNFYQPDMALQLDLAHTRIHTLVFGDDFDTKLDEIVLPCTLRKLQFGAHFNRSLKNVQIPSSLEELIFGHNFNQSMKGVNLGENLKTLVFGRMFNMSMRSWKIPHSVRHLTLGETYNHILKGVKFPELESFTFCGTFKEKVAEAEHRR